MYQPQPPPSDPYAAEQAAHVAGLGKALAAQGHNGRHLRAQGRAGPARPRDARSWPDRALHQGRPAGAGSRRPAAAACRRDRAGTSRRAGRRTRRTSCTRITGRAAWLPCSPRASSRCPSRRASARSASPSSATASPDRRQSARIRMEACVGQLRHRGAGAHL